MVTLLSVASFRHGGVAFAWQKSPLLRTVRTQSSGVARSALSPSPTRLWSSLEREPDSNKKRRLVEDHQEDRLSEFRNPKNREDQVFSALSKDGGIKVTAATCRNLMNDLMMQQTLSAVSAEALGRTVICSLLMANGIQEEQMVQITMNGDGPIRGIVAISTGKGHVRGYVGSPMLGDMTLPEAVGKGSVQVVKNHPEWPRPYNGITGIRHGDIDRDVGTLTIMHLSSSNQTNDIDALEYCTISLLRSHTICGFRHLSGGQ